MRTTHILWKTAKELYRCLSDLGIDRGGELCRLEDLAIKMIVAVDGLRLGKTKRSEATLLAADDDGDEGVLMDDKDVNEVGSGYGSDSDEELKSTVTDIRFT